MRPELHTRNAHRSVFHDLLGKQWPVCCHDELRACREDVDALLKERERFGDPMAHLVKKRPAVEPHIVPAALQKKMKKSGFVIPQDIPAHSYLKRNLGPPGNRYNIRPGRHWDGVDRSTGFERDMFAIINERKHRSQEAHMWSQGDM